MLLIDTAVYPQEQYNYTLDLKRTTCYFSLLCNVSAQIILYIYNVMKYWGIINNQNFYTMIFMYIMLYCTEHGSCQESTELVQNVIVTTLLTSTLQRPTSLSMCLCVCSVYIYVCVCVCVCVCTYVYVVCVLELPRYRIFFHHTYVIEVYVTMWTYVMT